MDAVMAEGLATAFSRDVTKSQPLWSVYPTHVADWVRELQGLTAAHAWPRYREWMIQHPDGRRWIGYRAGTYLADRAIKASGRSAADLASTPVSDILRLAGY